MNTKLILTSSALILGLAGILMTFAPDNLLSYANFESSKATQLVVQILGSLYFGFAMLNFMVKDSLIGGIYNRPIAIANLSHFMIAGLALFKTIISSINVPLIIWIIAVVYIIYAVFFAIIFMRHPVKT